MTIAIFLSLQHTTIERRPKVPSLCHAFYMYITNFIGFLLSINLVLMARNNVGTCKTRNEVAKPLTDTSAAPVKTITADKASQIMKKNNPQQSALAHKLGRCVYFMLKNKTVFDEQRFLKG